MSSAAIKAVAMLTMLLDHLGMVCGFPELRVIGRMAFPLFAFGIAEGWSRTHDKQAYFLRMVRFAGLSQIPFILTLLPGPWAGWHDSSGFTIALQSPWAALFALFALMGVFTFCHSLRVSDWAGLVPALVLPGVLLRYGDPGRWILYSNYNVFYTFTCSLAVLFLLDFWVSGRKARQMDGTLAAGGAVCVAAGVLFYGARADYSFFGVLLPVVLYIAGKSQKYGRYLQALALVLWSGLVYSQSMEYFIAAAVSCVPVLFYKPDAGPGPKVFRKFGYWFYPAHLAVLGALRILAG